MSIRTVVTRGYGAGASIGAVVLRGYFAEATGAGGFKRGGSGGKRRHTPSLRYEDVTTGQVEEWWGRYDALVKLNARLKQEAHRVEVEAAAEIVARTIEAVEEAGRPDIARFDAMLAAVTEATRALTAAKVIAAAKRAVEEAERVLQAIEDENAAILLLLA